VAALFDGQKASARLEGPEDWNEHAGGNPENQVQWRADLWEISEAITAASAPSSSARPRRACHSQRNDRRNRRVGTMKKRDEQVKLGVALTKCFYRVLTFCTKPSVRSHLYRSGRTDSFCSLFVRGRERITAKDLTESHYRKRLLRL
jgi:hypothetical protein